jgi:predicted transcriptional regulator YdeE
LGGSTNLKDDMLWLLLPAGVLLCVLAYLFTLPNSYIVTRSISIAKPASHVFPYVQDFTQAARWNPWLIHDANALVTLDRPTEVGGSSAWRSDKIGAGKTSHTAIVPHTRIEQKLAFFKPFKAQASVSWDFQGSADETCVTWTMHAKLPLPTRPFIPMISRMIGLDFELGLGQLRGLADPSAERPVIHFKGACVLPAQTHIVRAYSGDFEGMKIAMRTGYPELHTQAHGRVAGAMLAIYHSVNPAKQTTVCHMAVPVTHTLPTDAVQSLPSGRYFQTELKGNYAYLGPAWNAAYGQAKMSQFKVDKRRPALEVYETTPDATMHSNEWLTQLYIPIKN